jgi:hypothetical protein
LKADIHTKLRHVSRVPLRTRALQPLETAIGFLGQGMENVAIVDEKGRVFNTQEFSLADDD